MHARCGNGLTYATSSCARLSSSVSDDVEHAKCCDFQPPGRSMPRGDPLIIKCSGIINNIWLPAGAVSRAGRVTNIEQLATTLGNKIPQSY
jgi:hypothetical protein